YTLYMQDYGGPVGFRMALAHADRVEALIVQDAVAHNEGLGANWKSRRAFWADRAGNESALSTNLLSLPTTRTRHVGNDPNVERYDADLWTDEFGFLSEPRQADIQSDLLYDTRTNDHEYPDGNWLRAVKIQTTNGRNLYDSQSESCLARHGSRRLRGPLHGLWCTRKDSLFVQKSI